MNTTRKTLLLPIGLVELDGADWFKALTDGVRLQIPVDYERQFSIAGTAGEAFAIQRLLSLARNRTPIIVEWPREFLMRMPSSASLQPLLAVLLCLKYALHEASGLADSEIDQIITRARKGIFTYRLRGDMFTDSQILLCADSRGYGRPPDLYDRATKGLRSREDIETTVLSVLSPLLGGEQTSGKKFAFAGSLAVIVAELIENTELHGKLDLQRTPVEPDGMRGLLIRRINVTLPAHQRFRRPIPSRTVDGLEVSVFDSGVGYYTSYTRQKLNSSTQLEDEWKVMHKCFERHFDRDQLDWRQPHRGMGLYEVLRALQELKGSIEVRTGRLFAYRSFFEGELLPQMQPPSGPWARINFPKPVMLDVQNRLTPRPSPNDQVVGTAVRIVVPLV